MASLAGPPPLTDPAPEQSNCGAPLVWWWWFCRGSLFHDAPSGGLAADRHSANNHFSINSFSLIKKNSKHTEKLKEQVHHSRKQAATANSNNILPYLLCVCTFLRKGVGKIIQNLITCFLKSFAYIIQHPSPKNKDILL